MAENIWYEPWNYEAQYRRKQMLKEVEDYSLRRHVGENVSQRTSDKAAGGTGPRVYPPDFDDKGFPGTSRHLV